MPTRSESQYQFRSSNLFRIRNKNELRVLSMLEQVLSEYPEFDPDKMDIEDVYACALNQLPSRYVQHGTIVLREEISNQQVLDAIHDAVERVKNNPKY